ncbi:hypothetical protein B0H15DRAFT_868777 [Mycena belliarum]|uniref:Uncharacterized protein n=1 Tax=Mycena belliarum TaxID=1033014 RepID=A0AAD6TN67_9AGAR|nr:hypothetical protein B0H15DRAFT_868777 [Mycena belliae]
MASLTLLHSNYTDPDDQLESDIVDQHHELNYEQDEDELPPRPTSRIGFNSNPTPAEVPASPPRSRPGTLKWTRSLFQKIGRPSLPPSTFVDVDMDITAVVTTPSADEDDDLDPLSLPVLPSLSASTSTSSLSLNDMDVDTGSSCDDEFDDSDSDGYSSEDSEIEIDTPASYVQGGRDSLLFPRMPPPGPPPSPPPTVPPSPLAACVAILPANAPIPTFARRPTPVTTPPPAVRTKFSCLPSPLSPNSDDRIYYTNPIRHAYGHHGRSRHALLHLKYLWALREDQWDEHTSRIHDSYAYSGMVLPRAPPRDSTPPRMQSRNCLSVPPMTIHPRRGDLTALRDPYCAHMDRCFVGLPLWTMGKTLWMYDVHMLAEGRVRAVQITEATSNSEDEESEGDSMAASVSTAGFSDDSDETLVESGSEREAHSDDEALEEAELAVVQVKCQGDAKVPVLLSARSRPTYLSSKRPLSLCASVSASPPPPPRWETSWYKRWEILMELVRLDTERERAQHPPPAPPAARSPRFFIGEEDDDGDESWSEERWDEVLNDASDDKLMIVSNEVVLEAR